MQTYTHYKDSGIDWIGQIPEHWQLIPNKFIFRLKKNQVGKRSSEYDLLSLTLRGIIKRDMENPEGKFPADFDTYQEVKVNDFVFCLFDVEETPRTIGLSAYDGMITGAYTVMDPIGEDFAPYLYYYYLNADDKKQLKFLYRGLRNTIPKDSFFSLKTAIPPIQEQEAIANFLDDKTAKIDALVQTKEQQIEKLKELRQAKIHQAVTKGIPCHAELVEASSKTHALSKVEMKDSGVEWIGEIPAHWEVKRFKNVLKEINYRSKSGEEELLSLSKYRGIIPKSELEERAGGALSLIGYKLVSKHNIVINKMQAVNGLIGVSKLNGITSPDYSVYDTIIDCPEYIGTLMSLPLYLDQYKKVVTGVMEGFIRLYTDDLFNIACILPPIQEQKQIVAYLDEVTGKIDQAITQKQEQITKLKEYKQSLINNVVTGKVKVC